MAGCKIPPKEVERYYAGMLGKDYLKIEFKDMFGDKQVVGNLLKDPDNLIVCVVGLKGDPIWFSTSKKAVGNLKPMYVCKRKDSMADVPRDAQYMQLGAMGCPCVGVCVYGAIRFFLGTNVQIITVTESTLKTDWLVSHEVLVEGANIVGEAHCQEGSQRTVYGTFIPDILSEPAKCKKALDAMGKSFDEQMRGVDWEQADVSRLHSAAGAAANAASGTSTGRSCPPRPASPDSWTLEC